jgi:hypothetical protein
MLSSNVVEVAPGLVVASDKGAISGSVHSDAGLPVAGARVLVTSTSHATDTNARGEFQFVNVTPGPAQLRVERTGFQVYEKAVQVSAANLTPVSIVLLPNAGTGAGYLPHLHDYWRGQSSHIMFDAPYKYRESRARSDVPLAPVDPWLRSTVAANLNTTTALGRIPIPEMVNGQVNLVYPGAAEIKVKVSWDASSTTLSKIGVAYSYPSAGKTLYLSRQPSGSTWTIPVAPGETDVGHQAWTQWQFYLYPGNDVGSGTGWTPGLILDPFQVKIEVLRGSEVPVEPEHRDFWAGGNQLVLHDKSASFSDSSRRGHDRTTGEGHMVFKTGVIVPPGTTRLTINHTWQYQDLNQELAGTPADRPFVLSWRTGNQNPYTTLMSAYQTSSGTSCGFHCVSYEYVLRPGETDAFYQKRSGWAFVASFAGEEKNEQSSPDPRNPKHHFLEVTAWRDI